jgi:methionine-gamma-lyase
MNKKFSPESLMMSYGYDPHLSEGSLKCPIFQTSTFVFKSAEEGKSFFEIAYGKREKEQNESQGLIYSRINNPDLEILENRLCLWDGAEDCAVFESGMSGISTVLLAYLKPGDLMLFSNPLYGGTDHFIHHYLQEIGVHILPFDCNDNLDSLTQKIKESGRSDKFKMIYAETPANPTNTLIDIEMCALLAKNFETDDNKPIIAIDNTYMGPLWQHPLEHGADIVLYSATKYIGGHSDLIAGAVLGNKEHIKKIKTLRTFLGNMASPWTGWMLMRSLETLKIRMEKQQENALAIVSYLADHPLVQKIYYPGHSGTSLQKSIVTKQCKGTGAMIAFDIKGGEKASFTFLNNLTLFKLAVSLGGTESLAQHPHSMTHAGVPDDEKARYQISKSMVRLSIGIENIDDLIWDIESAFKQSYEKADPTKTFEKVEFV